MPNNIKRWVPFILLITVALVFSVSMLLNPFDGSYQPLSDDPQKIYNEACANCHGEKGEGSGLYPGLADELLDYEKVSAVIQNGALFMPAFKYIKGDTLKKLTEYTVDKKFKEIN